MFDEPVFLLDLETTGARPGYDRITEIGVVESNGGETNEWSTLVNPGCPIPPLIQSITGINDRMVATAPSFAELAEALHEKLNGRLIAAHNAQFDYGFLRAEFQRAGLEFRARTLCTVKLSRRLYPGERRHNLDSIIQRMDIRIAPSERHRALGDARVLAGFMDRIKADFDVQRLRTEISAVLQRPAYPTHLPPGTLEGIPDVPGVYIFYTETGGTLYVGKSVSLRSRVISHFTAAPGTDKEVRLAQQVRRMEWVETAGELGALLLEARLVKERAPSANRLLRKNMDLCSMRLTMNSRGALVPAIEPVDEVIAGEPRYGIFRSRRQANTALREIARSHQLCARLLGLEPGGKAEGPCFARQIRQCRGACLGEESLAAHNLRLQEALMNLRVADWPFRGRVGLRERSAGGDRIDIHVLEDWRFLGTARSDDELADLCAQRHLPPFDADIYKLLARHLKPGARALDVVELAG